MIKNWIINNLIYIVVCLIIVAGSTCLLKNGNAVTLRVGTERCKSKGYPLLCTKVNGKYYETKNWTGKIGDKVIFLDSSSGKVVITDNYVVDFIGW